MVYGEGRDINIRRIQQCIRDAKKHITTLLQKNQENDARRDVLSQENLALKLNNVGEHNHCFRLCEALKSAGEGLKNLQQTYRDDATVFAKLKILTDEITDYCDVTFEVTKRISSPAKSSESDKSV